MVNTKSALKEIQSGLKRLNLYRGNLDGVFGPATWKALRKFERRQNTIPLGLPTTELLKELRKVTAGIQEPLPLQASNLTD